MANDIVPRVNSGDTISANLWNEMADRVDEKLNQNDSKVPLFVNEYRAFVIGG